MTQNTTEIPLNSIALGERRLLAAILRRAVLDYLGDSSELVEEAKEWIFESSPSSEYSFHWICEYLGLQEEEFLERLIEVKSGGHRDSVRGSLEGVFA